jgi:hypothetical protein
VLLAPQKVDNRWKTLFYDPFGGYKDSWFGCYVIFDDKKGHGRNFMLVDSAGSVDDITNIRVESMCALTEIDQKLVYYSSHTGDTTYTVEQCNRDFYFEILDTPVISAVQHKDGREWKKIEASARTLSAFPAESTSPMKILSSIRSYCALPSSDYYETVSPWHEITVHGELYATYIENGAHSFWAVAYFNGSEFTLRNGETVNTWGDGSLRNTFRKAFMNLNISGVE